MMTYSLNLIINRSFFPGGAARGGDVCLLAVLLVTSVGVLVGAAACLSG